MEKGALKKGLSNHVKVERLMKDRKTQHIQVKSMPAGWTAFRLQRETTDG
jgi:hypothetical protein